VRNQEEHYRKKTFQEEYLAFLPHYGIPYDELFVLGLMNRTVKMAFGQKAYLHMLPGAMPQATVAYGLRPKI